MQQPIALTDGPVARGLIRFSIPLFVCYLLQSLNGVVNTIWVGKYLGEAALAAASVANAVIFLLVGSAFGAATIATLLIAQCIGANRLRDAKRVVGTCLTFFVLISVGLSALGIILTESILTTMRTPLASLGLAIAYLRIILLGLPSFYLYSALTSILRGYGDTKTPFYFTLFSVALDIGLNPILIFGVGFLPRMGISGSALATVAAQSVSLIAFILYLIVRRHPLWLRASELSFLSINWNILEVIVRKGIPMGAHTLVVSFGQLLMIGLVNQFGVDTTAAFGACVQIWNYILMLPMSIATATAAMTAQNIGAKRWERVTEIARASSICAILGTGCLILAVESFATSAIQLFLPAGSPAVRIAGDINGIVTWWLVFSALSMSLLATACATGVVIVPLAIAAVTMLGTRFCLAELLIDSWKADAIWWSFSISYLIDAMLVWVYYRYGSWRTARPMFLSDFVDREEGVDT